MIINRFFQVAVVLIAEIYGIAAEIRRFFLFDLQIAHHSQIKQRDGVPVFIAGVFKDELRFAVIILAQHGETIYGAGQPGEEYGVRRPASHPDFQRGFTIPIEHGGEDIDKLPVGIVAGMVPKVVQGGARRLYFFNEVHN